MVDGFDQSRSSRPLFSPLRVALRFPKLALLRTSLRGFGLFKQPYEHSIATGQRHLVHSIIAASSISEDANRARFMEAKPR